MTVTLGLDVGSHCLEALQLTAENEVRHRTRYRISKHTSPRRCLELLQRAFEDHRAINDGIRAVGLGFPGLIDPKSGMVRRSPLHVRWDNVRLAPALSKVVGRPVLLDNRINNAARAELVTATETDRSFLYVSGGSRISSALVLRGRVWNGATGLAGQIAHTPTGQPGEECDCGHRGCAADQSGSIAVARALGIKPDSLARSMQQSPQACEAALVQSGGLVGRAVAPAINLLNLEAVVLGGHLATYSAWRSSVELSARSSCIDEVQAACSFELSRSGADGRAVGAAMLGRHAGGGAADWAAPAAA